MSSVIVAAPPVTGEMAPMVQIAAGLVERGYSVTVLCGRRFVDGVSAVGARAVPLAAEADFDDKLMAELPSLTPGPDQLNLMFGLCGDAIVSEYHQLQELLVADPDAALITNSLFLGAWPLNLGAPGTRPRRWLGVGCNPLALPSADTTPLGPVPAGPDGDAGAANRAVNDQIAASIEPARRRIERAVRTVGGTAEVPDFFTGIVTVPDAFASLTVSGLEFPRSDAPSSLHLVGALPAVVPAELRAPSWWSDLDGDEPVVVVTQGTTANHDLDQLVRPTLDALAERNVLVVAALGRDLDALDGPVPDNARVESYVPFGALLERADIFVTNGGFGATQQALAAGTPVVVAGDTEDKPFVAARVGRLGYGRDLGTSSPGRTEVDDAVSGLLVDEEVRANVARLAQEYREHDAVEEIEKLLAG